MAFVPLRRILALSKSPKKWAKVQVLTSFENEVESFTFSPFFSWRQKQGLLFNK